MFIWAMEVNFGASENFTICLKFVWVGLRGFEIARQRPIDWYLIFQGIDKWMRMTQTIGLQKLTKAFLKAFFFFFNSSKGLYTAGIKWALNQIRVYNELRTYSTYSFEDEGLFFLSYLFLLVILLDSGAFQSGIRQHRFHLTLTTTDHAKVLGEPTR